MNIKEEEKREGFHVVDALLKHSPEIIKKIETIMSEAHVPSKLFPLLPEERQLARKTK